MNQTTRNRGFSIMETVIALVVIVLVTAAALSITLSAISARVKMSNYSEAQDFAHNVLECFKAADDNEDFEKYVAEVAGYTDMLEIVPDEQYSFENNKFIAQITANCATGEFDITINDKNGKEIISVDDYRKHTKG